VTEAPARGEAPVGETAFGWLRLVVGVGLVTVVPMWALGFGFFSGLPALNALDALSRFIVSAVAATVAVGLVVGLALAGWLTARLLSRALDRRSAASQQARYAEILGDTAMHQDAWAGAHPRPVATEAAPEEHGAE
jgi:hypothetical protein